MWLSPVAGSRAFSLNDSGQMAGVVPLPGQPRVLRAALWVGASPRDIDGRATGFSFAYSISKSGDIAGYRIEGGVCHAYVWGRTGARSLLAGSASRRSLALCCNDRGDVAGYADFAQGTHACVWIGGVARQLSVPGGERSSMAAAINSSGAIVGSAPRPIEGRQPIRAFLWSQGKTTLLEPLRGFVGSSATCINQAGDVAGWSLDRDGHQRATLWRRREPIDLGCLPRAAGSLADAINDRGQAVGRVYLGRAPHAALFERGTVVDLNGVVALPQGVVLEHATAVNNRGQILCQSNRGSVLLSPIR